MRGAGGRRAPRSRRWETRSRRGGGMPTERESLFSGGARANVHCPHLGGGEGCGDGVRIPGPGGIRVHSLCVFAARRTRFARVCALARSSPARPRGVVPRLEGARETTQPSDDGAAVGDARGARRRSRTGPGGQGATLREPPSTRTRTKKRAGARRPGRPGARHGAALSVLTRGGGGTYVTETSRGGECKI